MTAVDASRSGQRSAEVGAPVAAAALTRRRTLAGAAALPAGLLAACAPGERGGTSAGPARAPDKLPPASLYFTFYGEGQRFWPDVVAQFQTAHPGVTVQPERVAGSYIGKLRTLLAAGTPPDAFTISSTDYAGLVTQGGLAALDDLAKRDRYDLQDFWAAGIQQFTYRGKLWVLTENLQTFPLWYNEALFRRAGFAFPDDTWTPDILLERAGRLTRRTGSPDDQVGFAFLKGIQQSVYQYVLGNGGRIFDAEEDPRRGRFGDTFVVETLQWLADLTNRHRVTPLPEDLQGIDEATLFFVGRLAIHQRNIAAKVFEDGIKGAFRFAAARPPRGRVGHGATVLPHGNALSAAGAHREAAWALLQALAAPAAQRAEIEVVGTVTGRRSVVERHWQPGPEWAGTRRAVTAMLQAARPLPNTPHIGDAVSAINGELGALWRGEAAARQVAAAIDGRLPAILQGGGG